MAGEKNYIRYREEIHARVLKIEGTTNLSISLLPALNYPIFLVYRVKGLYRWH